MTANYKKLWHLLLDRDLKKRDLQRMAGISDYHIKKLTRNDTVPAEVLGKIVLALDCKMEDIVDFIPEDECLEENHE